MGSRESNTYLQEQEKEQGPESCHHGNNWKTEYRVAAYVPIYKALSNTQVRLVNISNYIPGILMRTEMGKYHDLLATFCFTIRTPPYLSPM